jgi:uncharacterized protein involved in tolerance to divalent cations
MVLKNGVMSCSLQHVINMNNSSYVFEASLRQTREEKYLHKNFENKMHKTCKKLHFLLKKYI